VVLIPTRYTTPEAMSLQALLKKMKDASVTHVIMEVSSHGLAQSRIGSLQFDVAAFTNFTRDHLDYHSSMEAYFQAKLQLFAAHLSTSGTAVLPVCARQGEPYLSRAWNACRKYRRKVLFWGVGTDADISLLDHTLGLKRTEMIIGCQQDTCSVRSPLVGYYNIENILTAFTIAHALQLSMTSICTALANASGAPGRVERVALGDGWPAGGPSVLVDYAHTPDALEKVLAAVKELPHRNLFCVFGCGGDRDKGKRAVMGAIAARFADVAILTDDNPRTEDPEAIIAEIESGIPLQDSPKKTLSWLFDRSREERGYLVIRDRRAAIRTAIRQAVSGDIVLIAGKGHEPYQLTIRGRNYFDDRRQAMDALLSWSEPLLAEACGANLVQGQVGEQLLGEITTDSRQETPGGIFVALKGENHDGHDFAAKAVAKGCRCLVVDRQLDLEGATQLVVNDTTRALGDLAAYRRQRLALMTEQLVIGITGSCGKTTVKEMTAAILQRKWPEGPDYPGDAVLKTQGNYNNLIGLPLSLLPLGVDQRVAVLEMGMNASGEIARLAEIAHPDISCIVNIHGAHLEGLGSIEGVAAAKEELFAGTGKDGILIVNLDDQRVAALASKYPQKKISFAVEKGAGRGNRRQPDIWASEVNVDREGVTTFILHYGDKEAEVHLFIAGEHNVSNSLCAAATAIAAGAELDHVVAGLADFRAPDKRMQICRGKGGVTIINDTYNANPASMAAGLSTLKQMSRGRSVAIVGDMLELGEDAPEAHYGIGSLMARLDLDAVAILGEYRLVTARGALENGLAENRIRTFEEKGEVVAWLDALLDTDDKEEATVLVKASRGLRFETIVARLLDEKDRNREY
jgi:murE/murF fusion protein